MKLKLQSSDHTIVRFPVDHYQFAIIDFINIAVSTCITICQKTNEMTFEKHKSFLLNHLDQPLTLNQSVQFPAISLKSMS